MNSEQTSHNVDEEYGNVYIMKHSLFSDVIRIGCTPDDPIHYTQTLSKKSPGSYTLLYAQACQQPCKVTRKVRRYLTEKNYINEFYEVSPSCAIKLFKQEVLRIPANSQYS